MKTIPYAVVVISLSTSNISFATDSDGDGIDDRLDRCSATPAGAVVWKKGQYIGCAEGQRIDRHTGPTKKEVVDSIIACEDNLDSHLSNREIYSGSECERYYYDVPQGADGFSSVSSGSITHGSNGVTYIHMGDFIHGSDGTTCVKHGDYTTCN